MGRIWAVARNTIRQALRMKVAVIFMVLLLVLLPVMGLTASGDGTLKGRLQTFLSYGLSLTSLLLSLLTIVVAIYTVTSDIEFRQIYTVATKPIRRFQLILGKLLGVIVLNLGLVFLFAGILYAVTVFMPRFFDASPGEMQQVRNEFYTARAGLVPPIPDVSEEVAALIAKLKENDQLGVIYPGLTEAEVVDTLTSRVQLRRRAADSAEALTWEFENVKPTDPNQSLFVRFRFDVGTNPPPPLVYARWIFGDLRTLDIGADSKTPIYTDDRKDPVDTFREIRIPADAVAEDGYLGIRFINNPVNGTVVLFPLEDGLEVLYKADSFTANFVRAVLVIICRLIFLACLGILAGTFLSFPVAIMLSLVVFFIGTVSGFVLESFGDLGSNAGVIYSYSIGALVRLLPRFDRYNPTHFLVPGRLLSWGFVAYVVFFMVCIKAFILLVLSLIIFSFRELARIVV